MSRLSICCISLGITSARSLKIIVVHNDGHLPMTARRPARPRARLARGATENASAALPLWLTARQNTTAALRGDIPDSR
jgi:hypothetical protein